MAGEKQQEVELTRRELERVPLLTHFSRGGIDFDVAEANRLIRTSVRGSAAAQHGTNSRNELAR
jgi:hypothetical protein